MNVKSRTNLEKYIHFLKGKGFQLGEEFQGFVDLGKAYTNASDELIIAAIEITLKGQRAFDGSFFISLLETFKREGLEKREEAIEFAKRKLNIL